MGGHAVASPTSGLSVSSMCPISDRCFLAFVSAVVRRRLRTDVVVVVGNC